MKNFAVLLLFVSLLLLTFQPIVFGGASGPALEMLPTATPIVKVTEAEATVEVATATAVPTPTLLPSPTAMPDTLVATFVETFPLAAYPATAPITIQFNQPMDASSSSIPLLLSPFAEGSASWNETFTALTLTPRTEWQGAMTTVTLSPQLRALAGLSVNIPQRWRLHHPLAPHVEAVPQAAAIADLYPTIRLRFDQPMEPASVLAALAVDPPLPFAVEWQSTTELALTFTEPLLPNQQYEVRLAKTAVSQTNIPLSSDLSWLYQLADPVAKLDANVKINGKTAVRLRFNYPIDPTLSDTLAFSPPISGTWRWENKETAVLFTPTTIFSPDTAYTLQFNAPLRDSNGLVLPTPATHFFKTPPIITSIAPVGTTVPVNSDIRIIFADLVDHAAAERAVTLTPATNGRFSWQNNTLTFTPNDNTLAPNTHYTVTVAPTLLATDGTPLLQNERTHQFTTAAPPPAEPVASFGRGEKIQQLFTNDRRAIQYEVAQLNASLTATLYPLTLPQFMQQYGTGFAGLQGNEISRAIAFDGLTAVSTWPLPATDYVAETSIPTDAAPGLYLLNLEAGQLDDQLFVILSDYTLAVKQGGDQLTAWVTDQNGRFQPNATITLYSSNGTSLAQAATNDDGLAYFTAITNAAFAVASVNNQTTVAGLGSSWTTSGGWGNMPVSAALYLYTDRLLYQPGQTVSYKAIIRGIENGRLENLPEGTAVIVTLHDPTGNIVETTELQTNPFGTVNGRFTLSPEAPSGGYGLDIVALGQHRWQGFSVEPAHNPAYSVIVTTDQPQPVAGDPVQITVNTATAAGDPIPHAAVTLNVYYRQPWNDLAAAPIKGETDANGRFNYTLPTSDFAQRVQDHGSMSLIIEAAVDDSQQPVVKNVAAITLLSTIETLTIHANSQFYPIDMPFDVQMGVHTIDNEPINGRLLQISLTRYDPSTASYRNAAASSGTTATNGQLIHSFTLPQPGTYKLQVTHTDARGYSFSTETYFYAIPNESNSEPSQGNLSLQLNKDQYAPGETAHLLIRSDFDGPALLTWERTTTHREQRIELTAPATLVEIPVLPGDAPNIYLVVNAWQTQTTMLPTGGGSQSLPESRLRLASINLVVPAADKQLQITLTPDKESYAPREEATFTVRVTNAMGVPISAELSLALVDEAVFALRDVRHGAIYDSFYFSRQRAVTTYDSFAPVRNLQGWGDFGGCGCGGDGYMEDIVSPHSDFLNTAVWLPTLTTDFNGEATVTVTLPDLPANWRLTAVAATADTQIGEAFISVQAR